MRRLLLLSALLATLTASGCTVCERDSAADGLYTLLTDCTGSGLVRGTVEIGPFAEGAGATTTLRATSCSGDASDGGVHPAGSADAGGAEPGGTPVCERNTYEIETSGCPQTVALGTWLLGLPSEVSVLGPRDFELHGEIDGRQLDCKRERFGDEKLLLCRERGSLVCVAVLEGF